MTVGPAREGPQEATVRKATILGVLAIVLVMAGPAKGETTAELAAQVRAAETAFAASMAGRDLASFGSFVADEALFFGRRGVLRGRPAVVEGWRKYFEGPKAPFSWAPETVEVLDSGTLALSSGPVYDPDGTLSGTFTSIWRREADGRWSVLFDKGCPVCPEPAKP
jgi:ketosteroid isomerase-like protein